MNDEQRVGDLTVGELRQIIFQILAEKDELESGSPQIPDTWSFKTPDGVVKGFALLSRNQREAIARGIHQGPSLAAFSFAQVAGHRVKDGKQTIAQIPEKPGDTLDRARIYAYMHDNPEMFGTDWKEMEGNEPPDLWTLEASPVDQ